MSQPINADCQINSGIRVLANEEPRKNTCAGRQLRRQHPRDLRVKSPSGNATRTRRWYGRIRRYAWLLMRQIVAEIRPSLSDNFFRRWLLEWGRDHIHVFLLRVAVVSKREDKDQKANHTTRHKPACEWVLSGSSVSRISTCTKVSERWKRWRAIVVIDMKNKNMTTDMCTRISSTAILRDTGPNEDKGKYWGLGYFTQWRGSLFFSEFTCFF